MIQIASVDISEDGMAICMSGLKKNGMELWISGTSTVHQCGGQLREPDRNDTRCLYVIRQESETAEYGLSIYGAS